RPPLTPQCWPTSPSTPHDSNPGSSSSTPPRRRGPCSPQRGSYTWPTPTCPGAPPLPTQQPPPAAARPPRPHPTSNPLSVRQPGYTPICSPTTCAAPSPDATPCCENINAQMTRTAQ